MVAVDGGGLEVYQCLSVLALSSRFDGRCGLTGIVPPALLSVLALSSRFDGRRTALALTIPPRSFSTRSVESF